MTIQQQPTWQDIARGYRKVVEQVVNAFSATYGQEPLEKLVSMVEAIDAQADTLTEPGEPSSDDFATGKRIARQCKQMSIAAFAAALEQEMDFNRFDYEGGETEWMEATITALLAYTSAGGTLDLGHGWRIEQDDETHRKGK